MKTIEEYIQQAETFLTDKAGVVKDYKQEWGWFRYSLFGKMFAAICQPSDAHASEYAGHILLTLKCDPLEAEFLRKQYNGAILPGFYMDKRNWISICLDKQLPSEQIQYLCEQSYRLIYAKLTKLQKAQVEQSKA